MPGRALTGIVRLPLLLCMVMTWLLSPVIVTVEHAAQAKANRIGKTTFIIAGRPDYSVTSQVKHNIDQSRAPVAATTAVLG